MRKKVFAILVIICLLNVILVAPLVFARETACGVAGQYDPLICGYGEGGNQAALQNRIKNVLETVYLWIGILAVIMIVAGGIRYMTSGGDDGKIRSAKNTIMYSIIGLIVTLMAFAITEAILGSLVGKTPGEYAAEDRGIIDDGSGGDNPEPEKNNVSLVDPVERPNLTEEWKVSVVTLSQKSASLKAGDRLQLSAKVYPENAADTSLIWASSNENVATVEQDGEVLAVGGGTTNITATSRNNIRDTATVTVQAPEKPTIVVKKTTLLDEHTTTAKVEKNKGDVKWSSSDTKVMKVDKNGKVKAKHPGKATLIAKTKNEANKDVELKTTITVRAIRVLWVGNSKTHVYDVDKKFESLVKKEGYSIDSTRVTKNGSTLMENYEERGKNIKKSYDYAIIQEQTSASIKEDKFYKGAHKVVKALKNKNNKVKLYVRKTWYLSNNKSIAKKIAGKVISKLEKNGYNITAIHDGDVMYAAQSDGLSVFKSDNRHQNKLGAYAVAACAAATMFDIDPTDTSYSPSGLSSKNIKAVRKIAKKHCYK